jgi:ArsR family transcriptional regulator, arsenate/arsenite/antimonite-responsive transcriptional repressor
VDDMIPCCSPIAGGAMPVDRAVAMARVFRALGDPARLRLISLILAAGGEACVCDLTDQLGLSQSTVSHHLSTLVRAGLVTRDKRGVWAWYSVRCDVLEGLSAVLVDAGRPVAAGVR